MNCLRTFCIVLVLNVWHVSSLSYNNWLSEFQDTLLVKLPVLPGSHNSGAISVSDTDGWSNAWMYAQTQTLSITEQLELGVRFLDLRLHVYYNQIDIHDKIVISHLLDSNLTLSAVLGEVNAFLVAQPTEFVVLYLRIDSEHALDGDVSGKQEYVRDTIIESGIKLSGMGSSNVATVRVSSLAGKVLLLGPDSEVLPASSSSFKYVNSLTSYSVCDIWQESTIASAEAAIATCFPTVPLSGAVSGIINGYALDGYFNNQPPIETSTVLNAWFFDQWTSNSAWLTRKTKPIGVLLLDNITEESMAQIFDVVSSQAGVPVSKGSAVFSIALIIISLHLV